MPTHFGKKIIDLLAQVYRITMKVDPQKLKEWFLFDIKTNRGKRTPDFPQNNYLLHAYSARQKSSGHVYSYL